MSHSTSIYHGVHTAVIPSSRIRYLLARAQPILRSSIPLSNDEAIIYISRDGLFIIVRHQNMEYTVPASSLFLKNSTFSPIGSLSVGTELLCFLKDLSRVILLPESSEPLPIGLLPTNIPSELSPFSGFQVHSVASNGMYHLLCDSNNGNIAMVVDGAFKILGRLMSMDEQEPLDGGPSTATLGATISVASTNHSDILFYAVERHRIRALTSDTITTISPFNSPLSGLGTSWPQSLCSIAVGTRGEIYVADSSLRSIARIERGFASMFVSPDERPEAAYLSLSISKDGKLLATNSLGEFHLFDTALSTTATDPSGQPTSTSLLASSEFIYNPHSKLSPGTFPIAIWANIAHYLPNSEVCRLRLLHPRLSKMPNLRLQFELSLRHIDLIQDPFRRVFDTRLGQLLPYLEDFTVHLAQPPPLPLAQQPAGQIRPPTPNMHIPATIPSLGYSWPLGLKRLVLHIPISFESSSSLFGLMPFLHTVELHRTLSIGLPFLSGLPSTVRRLCLPHLGHAIPLCVLPSKLTYLDLSSAKLAPESILLRTTAQQVPGSKFPPILDDLSTLLISSADISREALKHLPRNITRLVAEKSEWLTSQSIPALPNSILHLEIRQAIQVNDACAELLPSNLLSLDLSRNLIITNRFVKGLAKQCLEMEDLNVAHSPHISLYALPHIELFSKMRKLTMPIQFSRDLKVDHIFRLPRSLEELDLTDCRCMTTPVVPPHLWQSRKESILASRRSPLNGSSSPNSPPTPAVETGFYNFNPFSETPIKLEFYSESRTWLPPLLKVLKLGYMDDFPESAFYLLPASLTYLNMKQCQSVSQQGLEVMGELLPGLQYLNLKYVRTALNPSFIQHLPRNLPRVVLPLSTQALLRPYNFALCGSLPLTELKLHLRPVAHLTSNIFFLLPATLKILSMPHLKSVEPRHWRLLPSGLCALILSSVLNATDRHLQSLPRLLEILDLSSSAMTSPMGVRQLRVLKTLSLGTDWKMAHSFEADLPAQIASLPHSLTSLSFPQCMNTLGQPALSASSFVELPNLKHIEIGKFAPHLPLVPSK